MKDRKQIHIDNIGYKFDQLKVETLEGTLNIGLNPSAIEDLAVNKQSEEPSSLTSSSPVQDLREEIMKEMMSFLNNQVPVQLKTLQTESGHDLDRWHQEMIIQDLSRQLDQRVAAYLSQMESGASMDQISSVKDSVIFRTSSDSAIQIGCTKVSAIAGSPFCRLEKMS